ncbi:MAG: acyl-CoA thioesterase [Peptococcaceae bacterium]|nr:acyl-CoA thioesterase [Peptococcaceae bacterium]
MAEHCYKHKVQYYETDQMGMVHHSNYIRWFEEARVDYLDAIGLPYKQMEEEGIGSPVLEMHCQYKSKVTFGETVTIRVRMKSYTGLRFSVVYEVIGEDGKLRCTGESGHCFMTMAGRPLSIKKAKPEWHELLLQHAGEE